VPDGVVGRERELEAAARFLEASGRGPAALVFEGEPGIGKSTVWQAGCALAAERGHRVLASRPARPDKRLSFAGLGDLYSEVDTGQSAQLPEPQRKALAVALLRDGGGPAPDRRAVFTAVLTSLTALAADVPVVLAIDDFQWLDPPSLRALEFVARRVRTQRVGFLLSSRAEDSSRVDELLAALGDGRGSRLQLGPLSLAGTQRILKDRLGRNPARPVLLRIHETSRGNPFFALELARALGTKEPKPGEPLPVPIDIAALVRRRIERLPKTTRAALLRAAILSDPSARIVGGSLAPARKDGLIRDLDDGRIEFSHPLYASAVYEAARPEDRRRAHRDLAEQVDDIEQRARHLALASSGPEEGVATELDRAAQHASSRGAPETAAQLWELALSATPAGDEAQQRHRRSLAAANAQFSSGAIERARELLMPLVDQMQAGDERADVFIRLTDVSRDFEEMRLFANRALREAEGDIARARGHLAVGFAEEWHLHDVLGALRHGYLALRHAERAGDPRLLAETLGLVAFWELISGRTTPGLLAKAIELRGQTEGPRLPGSYAAPGMTDPRFSLALRRLYEGRLKESRVIFMQLVEEATNEGHAPAAVLIYGGLVNVELRAGSWRRAGRHCAAMDELAEQIGYEHFGAFSLTWKALVAAHLGDVAEARSVAELGITFSRRADEAFLPMFLGVLGFLELSLGNEHGALPYLRPILERLEEKKQAIATYPIEPYALEALVAAGELEEARSVIAQLEDEGHALDSPYALASAARARGMLAAAEGDLNSALKSLEIGLAYDEDAQWPFARARTLLAVGRVRRRAKQKAAAKNSLEQALAICERLPAPLWAERARDELQRIGLRRTTSEGLTETERRVAELAASGLKNREVAARLFMTPKTVEANLARAYRKLGIHSRAELGARLANAGREPAQT
jgi:DNA-binding CsgD family transcriptional regulator/DNA polymerase III delta prime subunit